MQEPAEQKRRSTDDLESPRLKKKAKSSSEESSGSEEEMTSQSNEDVRICTELSLLSKSSLQISKVHWTQMPITYSLWQPSSAQCYAARLAKIQAAITQWEECGAEIKFKLLPPFSPAANIRIGFKVGVSSSFVGTEAIQIEAHITTMNLGWIDEDDPHAVIHEFGHALGFLHEHQHPESPLQLNTEQVIKDMNRINGKLFRLNFCH